MSGVTPDPLFPYSMSWLDETPDAPVPAGPVHYFEHGSPICHDERDPCLGTHNAAQATCDDCREILTAAERRERQTREEL